MRQQVLAPRASAGELVRDAAITLVAALLAYAALDDITTGHEPSLSLEYALVATCAVWAGMLIVNLIRTGQSALAAISLLALSGAAWGMPAIWPGIVPGLWPGYVAVSGAMLWFLALPAILLWRAWRLHRLAESLARGGRAGR